MDERMEELKTALRTVQEVLEGFKVTLQVERQGSKWVLCLVDETTGKSYGVVEEKQDEKED